jgi:hypothetical protein
LQDINRNTKRRSSDQMYDSLKEESKRLSSILNGNGYVLGQLMIEDIQNLGIAMDKQIVPSYSRKAIIIQDTRVRLLHLTKKSI